MSFDLFLSLSRLLQHQSSTARWSPRLPPRPHHIALSFEAMRYEDWDILLFPRDCKVPIKEFKVACHVVHDLGESPFTLVERRGFTDDQEFSHGHGSYGLPTVCCFVPSLPPGSPFQVSLHSWSPPNISQFTRSYSKYAEMVKFEARLFVDGRLIAYVVVPPIPP